MQRKITKELPSRKENLDQMIEASIKMLKTFQEHNEIELGTATFLEIGAGRNLAITYSQYMDIFSESGFRVQEALADREKHDDVIIDDLADQSTRFELNNLFTIRARICAAPESAIM